MNTRCCQVAALFCRADSVYKEMPGVDAWDIERDACRYCGKLPVVAHPPCRAWGRLRGLAKPRPGEKALALFAVEAVRRCGGVLEHPEASSLWGAADLPLPGRGKDEFGGWTLAIEQKWFGHRAQKKTWLYIVGVEPRGIPDFSISLDLPQRVITSSPKSRRLRVPECSKAEREHTPPEFARWLVDLASRCAV